MSTTSKDTYNEAWWLPLRWLRGPDGRSVGLWVKRPSWHSAIFGVGLAGLSRNFLNSFHPGGGACAIAYASCVMTGLVVGQLIEGRSARTSRVYSAMLGHVNFALAVLHGAQSVAAPLAASGSLIGLTLTGEILFNRVKGRGGSPAAGDSGGDTESADV